MALKKVNQDWDKCLGKFAEYGVKGSFIGLVIGLALFKKRVPSIAYFTGLGIGCASVENEKKINNRDLDLS